MLRFSFGRWWCAAGLLLLASLAVSRQPNTNQRLAEAKALGEEVRQAFGKGDLPQALKLVQKKLSTERAIGDEGRAAVLESLAMLADIYEELVAVEPDSNQRPDRLDRARKTRQEALALAIQLYGEKSWQATDARLALAYAERVSQLSPQDFLRLAFLRVVENKLLFDHSLGTTANAPQLSAIHSVCTVQALAGGPNLEKFTGGMKASLPVGAEATLIQVREIREKLLGARHPYCAASWNNLGVFHYGGGNLAKATDAFKRALEVQQQALGTSHPQVATTLGNLALVYQRQGDFARALPCFQEAQAVVGTTLGKDSAAYALASNNLAGAHLAVHDTARAVPLFLSAVAIYEKDLATYANDCAIGLNNLASAYQMAGDMAEAQKQLERAAGLLVKAGRAESLQYAATLVNLAAVCQNRDKFAEAQALYDKGLALQVKLLAGNQHADVANTKNNMALLLQIQGKFAEAEKLHQEVLATRKALLHADHPHVASTLANLAALYWTQGQKDKAEPLLREALRMSRTSLDLSAATLSERQQLAMAVALRHRLDNYLSLVGHTGPKVAEVYGHVLAWKGAVFLRQRQQRELRHALEGEKDAQVRKLYQDLENTTRQLAALAFSQPAATDAAAWQQRLGKLTADKENLEEKLAQRSAAFARHQELTRPQAKQVEAILPPGTALVDFLEYQHTQPSAKHPGRFESERRVAAFILRGDQPLCVEDLGPASKLGAAIDNWLQITVKGSVIAKGQLDYGNTLRQLLWDKVAPHLQNVQTVLVAPDGALTRLPLAALPGSKPGTYLVQERTFVNVPVPQLLPGLLAQKPAKGAAPSLLLVGDVDYDAVPGAVSEGSQAVPREALLQWKKLVGTKEEITLVAQWYRDKYEDGKLTELRKGKASEAAVRKALAEHRWVHLATHGFFAPKQILSALGPSAGRSAAAEVAVLERAGIVGYHPGLLSGVVLAGANKGAGLENDDGILTALEVAALDLREVEMVVLSACETGLGELAGGEGVLGLQRAFQVAGARTTVASLWTVDDKATRDLMQKFYAELWAEKGTLSKVEALRQAQLWMLKEGPDRGAKLKKDEVPGVTPTSPPYYWAAFVLSGDWR